MNLRYFLIIILIPFFFADIVFNQKSKVDWEYLAKGIYLGKFKATQKAEIGDSEITILKINPHNYHINIYCASEYHKKSRSAKEWAKEFNLMACINAGMYAKDYLTSVGYLQSGQHLNNSIINKSYRSIFACNPVEKDTPPIKLIDRQCENFLLWRDKYNAFLQSIRMISCQQKNVWEQQPKKWSIAALAVDKIGNLLLIHCHSPYSVHDFIKMLLNLPINIDRAMYLEGGPLATLYYSVNEMEDMLVGGPESGFFLNPNDSKSFEIPNIIGIKRKN